PGLQPAPGADADRVPAQPAAAAAVEVAQLGRDSSRSDCFAVATLNDGCLVGVGVSVRARRR
ncbi:MAG: hypothetical protein ABWZ63_01585, partial [Thermoleophilaceae bacterium]